LPFCLAATEAEKERLARHGKYLKWLQDTESGVRAAGSTHLHYSAEIEAMFGPLVALLAARQGYDLRYILMLIAAGLKLSEIFSDGSTHPLAPVANQIAAAFGVVVSPQVVPMPLGGGRTYKPDIFVKITDANTVAVIRFLRCLGASDELIAQILSEGELIGDTKCHCATVTQESQHVGILSKADALRLQRRTLIVIFMSDTGLVACIRARVNAPFHWDVLGRVAFELPGDKPGEACDRVNRKLSYPAQQKALKAYATKHEKAFFSKHPLSGQPFVEAEVVASGSKALVGGNELLFLLPPDSVVRCSQPPLRPPDLALLVWPLLEWLPTADRAALVEHQPAAYAAAAKAHADGQAPRAAAAVASAAASLSPPGPLRPCAAAGWHRSTLRQCSPCAVPIQAHAAAALSQLTVACLGRCAGILHAVGAGRTRSALRVAAGGLAGARASAACLLVSSCSLTTNGNGDLGAPAVGAPQARADRGLRPRSLGLAPSVVCASSTGMG
jgi:hypothetical protein